jgi:hypothetical protein
MIGSFRAAMPEIVIDMDMAGPATLIADAFDLLFSARSRVVEIRGSSPNDRMINVRMVIDETMLRDEMRDFAWRIFVLSIVISLITAGLVFLSLHGLMVRPVRRMVDAIMAFRRDPENPAAIVPPTTRGDELGEAQRELAEMQIVLRSALRQQQRLATLGTAVAKIHHDLGGIEKAGPGFLGFAARWHDLNECLSSHLKHSFKLGKRICSPETGYNRSGSDWQLARQAAAIRNPTSESRGHPSPAETSLASPGISSALLHIRDSRPD